MASRASRKAGVGEPLSTPLDARLPWELCLKSLPESQAQKHGFATTEARQAELGPAQAPMVKPPLRAHSVWVPVQEPMSCPERPTNWLAELLAV